MRNHRTRSHCRKTVESFILAALIACRPAPPPAGDVRPAVAKAVSAADRPSILFPDGTVYDIEVVADDPGREQGLMYRESLPPHHGMLFIFPASDIYPFWMKNTIIPLDIIWTDENGAVVHIEKHVPPCTADPCPSYSPEVVARYVLELAGGEADSRHLANGQRLAMRNLGSLPVH
jgi:uncharacterized membrane protein (UPF0127 family)